MSPTNYVPCEHFKVGDACLVALEHMISTDIALMFDISSSSMSSDDFSLLTTYMASVVENTFPHEDLRSGITV